MSDEGLLTEERFVDRSEWGPGPWDDEPDRMEFEHAGFPCLIVRNNLGALCGYVGVRPGHPLHGRLYRGIDIRVHGGLTYSNDCQGRICHVPKPGEDENVWWFGFDCGHGHDLVPRMDALYRKENLKDILQVTYRNMAYVRGQVERLANALNDPNVHVEEEE